MQLQMTYTVEEEDALMEAARILGNAEPMLAAVIEDYKGIVSTLSGESEEPQSSNKTAVIAEASARLVQFRTRLLQLDTRAGDITQILEGLDNFWRTAPGEAEDAQVLPST